MNCQCESAFPARSAAARVNRLGRLNPAMPMSRDIDVERLVWDPEYRDEVRPYLRALL